MDIIIGSRGSKLALAQSEEVKRHIEALSSDYHVSIKVISTKGDQILDKPLNQIGDKGLFTKEIEEQLFRLRRSPLQNMQQINYLKIELQKLQAEIKNLQQDL